MIEFTYLTIYLLKVYNSVILSIFMKLCNHFHNQLWNVSSPPKNSIAKTVAPSSLPTPTTSALGNHQTTFCLSLPILDISYNRQSFVTTST